MSDNSICKPHIVIEYEVFLFLEKFVNSLNVIAFLDKIGTLIGSREAACGGHQMASPPSNTGKA